jgi:hypothetical protein
MTSPPERRDELEPVTFGTIIVSNTHNNGEPSLVVEETREDGIPRVEAMLYVPGEQRYGLPGTIPVDEIDEVVGKLTYAEAINAMARAITGGDDPDQALLERVRELTSEYAPQE